MWYVTGSSIAIFYTSSILKKHPWKSVERVRDQRSSIRNSPNQPRRSNRRAPRYCEGNRLHRPTLLLARNVLRNRALRSSMRNLRYKVVQARHAGTLHATVVRHPTLDLVEPLFLDLMRPRSRAFSASVERSQPPPSVFNSSLAFPLV